MERAALEQASNRPVRSDEDGSGPWTVGLVTPSWPRELAANGISTCLPLLQRGLTAQGVRSLLLPWVTRAQPGADVIPMPAPDYSGRGLEWLAARVRARLWPDEEFQRQRARVLKRTVSQLRQQQDLALVQVPDTFGNARGLARATGVATVVRLHGPWFLNGPVLGVPRDRHFEWRVREERRGIEDATAVSAPSQSVLDATREHYGLALENARVLPNAVESVAAEHLWTRQGCDPERLLFVGRFDRHKGGGVVVQALARVLARRPTAALTFVGPDRGLVDDAGRRWSFSEYVEHHLPSPAARSRLVHLGQQTESQVLALRKQAAITIVASRYETFGNTALEAMAQGCPLVCTDVGGLAEVVRDGASALVVRPGDPQALAEALLALLADPKRAEALGRGGRERAIAHFDTERLGKQTADFFREVLERWRGAGRYR